MNDTVIMTDEDSSGKQSGAFFHKMKEHKLWAGGEGRSCWCLMGQLSNSHDFLSPVVQGHPGS